MPQHGGAATSSIPVTTMVMPARPNAMVNRNCSKPEFWPMLKPSRLSICSKGHSQQTMSDLTSGMNACNSCRARNMKSCAASQPSCSGDTIYYKHNVTELSNAQTCSSAKVSPWLPTRATTVTTTATSPARMRGENSRCPAEIWLHQGSQTAVPVAAQPDMRGSRSSAIFRSPLSTN